MLGIGAVTPRSVRIWARSDAGAGREIRWRERAASGAAHSAPIALDDPDRDFTGSIRVSNGFEPDRRYAVTLHGPGGEELASGSFTTAPLPNKPPERFAFGLMSCHQPFTQRGLVSSSAEPMLEAAWQAFEEHGVRHVVLAGDQLYADAPRRLSLFDQSYFQTVAPPGRQSVQECSAQEVRRLFHERYRHFWSLAGWRRLLSSYPCYPILDDHDILDNWGSAVEHADPDWQNYRTGALQAYRDYQHTLVDSPGDDLPNHFDYRIEFADTATYVMDLRSNRRVGEDARIVSSDQLEAFAGFLASRRAKRLIFVVLSVPMVHLPSQMTKVLARIPPDGEDFSDRWSSRGHVRDRDRILRLLHAHQREVPHQRIVLLSGDIHIGCLHRLRWSDSLPGLYQFISSGITNDAGVAVQAASGLLIRGTRKIAVEGGPQASFELVGSERGARRNPCARLNFGIVELSRRVEDEQPLIRFMLFSRKGHRPRLMYRSPLLNPLTSSGEHAAISSQEVRHG